MSLRKGRLLFPKFNIGKSGEEYISYLINKLGFECHMNNEYELRYDYDLIVNMSGLKFTIEVKHDVMSIKTKNMAIEYHNSKKDSPSGIYATLADIWIQLLPYPNEDIHSYAINTKKLIEYTEKTEPFKHIIAGGDKNSNLRIYKLVDILPQFVRIDNITNPNIMKSTFETLLCS